MPYFDIVGKMLFILILILVLWRSTKQFLPPIFSITLSLKKLAYQKRDECPKLPPSPPRLPIIGHLHLVGSLPHRSFQHLAKKYGPIMYLKLGSMPVIVVSSPQMAELLLRNHDKLCATRPKSQVSHHLSYNFKGITFTPYGPTWHNHRKLCVIELLSNSKIQSFAWLRKEELEIFIGSIKYASKAKLPVNVGNEVGSVLENLIHRMLFGAPKDEELALQIVALEVLRLSGTLNIADYLPFLAPFDFQGLNRSIKRLMTIMDNVLEKIINEHETKTPKDQQSHRDMVDVMVSLMKSDSMDFTSSTKKASSYPIERDNIKAILIDLFVPAIDSATNIIKWALSSLIKHPEKMRKLQSELDNIVSMDRMVEEKDLPKLHYLDMVIKEIFRLYPIIFAPHEAMEDITFDGYYIPKGSKIFLNSWAIGRDPKIWSEDCEEFNPERFLNNNVDIISGQDFRLTPFGSGRRRCPGTQLGLLNVKLLLSQLVHCFDWNMSSGKSPDDLVMQEKFGLVMSMVYNLELIPTYRLNV